MTRRRALLLGWFAALALSATLPLAAIFRGVVHVGTAPFIVQSRATLPIISAGSDVILRQGSSSLVLAFGGNVQISGTVDDDVVGIDGRVYMRRASRVRGDIVTILGAVYRQPDAHVEGRIGGALHGWNGQMTPRTRDVGAAAVGNVRLGLAAGLALLLIGTCLVIVFPWQIVLIATTLRQSPIKSFLAGAVGLMIFVFLVVPLGLSLAGLPFALVLTGGAGLAWLFGIAATSVVLGRAVARRPVSLVWAAGAGLLILALSMAIPFLGPLLITALGLTGAGALAVALLNRAYPVRPAG